MNDKKADDAGNKMSVAERIVRTVEDERTRSWSLLGLLILAILAALYLGRDLLLPIALALILNWYLPRLCAG